MARRKKSGGGMNLDSLLDTLTNVVGFLIMLMVLMQLGVGEAVKRIKEANPELGAITEEQLADMQQEAREMRELRRDLEAQWRELSPKVTDFKVERARMEDPLTKLRDQAAKLPPTSPTDEKETLLESELERAKELEQKVLAAQEEMASLRAMLAETPEPVTPNAKVVNLPNPRPAPKGARPIYFFCRGGQIYPVDVDELRKTALTMIERVPGAKRPDGTINCDRVEQIINSKTIGDRIFAIRLEVRNYNLYMRIEPRPASGETIEQLSRPSSEFQRAARKALAENHYGRFFVWNDSYDVYLEARKFTDKIGMAAGWSPFHENYRWQSRLHEIKCFNPEPPPPPKPKPANPQPPKPKPKPPLPLDLID